MASSVVNRSEYITQVYPEPVAINQGEAVLYKPENTPQTLGVGTTGSRPSTMNNRFAPNPEISYDFGVAVAAGKVPGHRPINLYGHAESVDTADVPASLWHGSGVYDFYPASGVAVSAVSDNIADSGNLVSSGITTSCGNIAGLIDDDATFQSDGVAEGHVVINDTQGSVGYVEQVVSETELITTVMSNWSISKPIVPHNHISNSYRIASASATGAAVIHIEGLDSDFNPQTETVILDGDNPVSLTGEYARIFQNNILLAGSSGQAAGLISISDDEGTYKPAGLIDDGDNNSDQLIFTVPAGHIAVFLQGYVALASGDSDSNKNRWAKFTWRARPYRGVFMVKGRAVCQSQGSGWWSYRYGTPMALPAKADIVVQCDEVSDNTTGVVSGVDLILIDVSYL